MSKGLGSKQILTLSYLLDRHGESSPEPIGDAELADRCLRRYLRGLVLGGLITAYQTPEGLCWTLTHAGVAALRARLGPTPAADAYMRELADVSPAHAHADILAYIRSQLPTPAALSGVSLPKGRARVATELLVGVSLMHDGLGGRFGSASIRAFCDAFELRPGTERHRKDGLNTRWRVLDRVRLDAALAAM